VKTVKLRLKQPGAENMTLERFYFLLLITIGHFQRALEKDTEDEYIGIDKQGTQKKE